MRGHRHVGHDHHQRPARGHLALPLRRFASFAFHPDVPLLFGRESQAAGAGRGIRSFSPENRRCRPAALRHTAAVCGNAQRVAPSRCATHAGHSAAHGHRSGKRHEQGFLPRGRGAIPLEHGVGGRTRSGHGSRGRALHRPADEGVGPRHDPFAGRRCEHQPGQSGDRSSRVRRRSRGRGRIRRGHDARVPRGRGHRRGQAFSGARRFRDRRTSCVSRFAGGRRPFRKNRASALPPSHRGRSRFGHGGTLHLSASRPGQHRDGFPPHRHWSFARGAWFCRFDHHGQYDDGSAHRPLRRRGILRSRLAGGCRCYPDEG